MYNEAIKYEYMNDESTLARNENVVGLSGQYFKGISSFEEKLGKDCSSFTYDEIISYYKHLGIKTTPSRLSTINSQFKMYTQWCIEKGLVRDNINHYAEVTRPIIDTCVNKALLESKVITREKLLSMLDKISNVSDQFLVLAIFEGLQFEDLVDLQMSAFNGNQVDLASGRTLTVSDKLVALAEESASTYEKYPLKVSEKNRMSSYDPTDTSVFKRSVNAYAENSKERKRTRANNVLTSIRNATGENAIGYSQLRRSGAIDLINHYAKESNIDWTEAYKAHRDEVKYRYFGENISNFERLYAPFFYKAK